MKKEIVATIIKDIHAAPKNSRIGEKVTILRWAPRNKVWIRLADGSECVWRLTYLKVIN